MSEPENTDGERAETGFAWSRMVPVAILLAGLATFFLLDLDRFVTFETLREQRHWLTAHVAGHAVLAALAYMALYAVAVAFSAPVGLFLSLAGGFLFGKFLGTFYTVAGATIGAVILFLVAKSALGDPLRRKAGPWLHRLEDGFRENALSYLLVLRLIVVFPFWVVNLVPAFLGVPLRTYVIGTFFGIIPGAFVYNLAGAGLGETFESGDEFNAANIFNAEVIGAFCGLAVLALLPVARRKWKARRGAS